MQRVALILVLVVAALAVWFFAFRDDGDRVQEPVFDGTVGLSPIDFDTLQQLPTADSPELATKGEKPVEAEGEPEVVVEVQDGVAILGRVLDDRRRPVAGVKIVLASSYAPEQNGLGTRTDESGRYRLEGVARPDPWGWVFLHAKHGALAGFATAQVSTRGADEVRASDLLLGPAHRLSVQVHRAGGAPVSGAQVLLEASHGWTSLVVAHGTADAEGLANFDALPEGAYRILAASEGSGRGTLLTALPLRKPGPVSVELGPERLLVARVVDKDTGDAIAGARVAVDELLGGGGRPQRLVPWVPTPRELVTDTDGRVTIPGLGSGDRVQLGAEAEGYPKRGNTRMHGSLPLEITETRIELQKLRDLRFPLAADNPHAPADGTKLEVTERRGAIHTGLPATARIEGEYVVAEGCSPGLFNGVVVAPDGAYGQIFARPGQAPEREVVFLKPRTVVVIMKRADGTPAEGTWVSARNQGNNVIVDPVQLGPEGRIELSIRYAHLLDFFASSAPSAYAGRAIGSLDLKKEEGGTIEASLPAASLVELAITIGGEARLPPAFSIRGARIVTEEPERGVVTFELAGDPGKPRKATLSATGFLNQTLEIPPTQAGQAAKVAVTLSRGGRILLRIKPPTDGRMNVQVVTPKEKARGYRFGPGTAGAKELGTDDGWLLRSMGPYTPGMYVASDTHSQARTEPFEVKEGEELTVSLDLSQVGVVKGKVEVPEGFTANGARVHVGSPKGPAGMVAAVQGAYVRKDGTFQIRVPGNSKVTLHVSHPQLIGAPQGGTVDVTQAREDVVLKLVEGASAHFKIDPAPTKAPVRPGSTTVDVYLYKGDAEGMGDVRLNAKQLDDTYSVSGFAPGSYTVVVSVRKRAPVNLGVVKLDKNTDLGLVTTTTGTTIRIKLLLPEGQDAPRIFASARASTGPAYSRFINSRGEKEVLLEGLGAGTFTLSARTMQGIGSPGSSGGASINETIECSGEGEIVRELDLR